MTGGVGLNRDTRSLPPQVLEDLRRRAVAAVESGVPQVQVALLYGVSRKTVGVWVRAYRMRGADSFRARKRGRRSGEQLALSPVQQSWIVKLIDSGPPDELGLDHRLWTRQAVAELIDREFRVGLSSTTVGQYFVRWGILPEANLLHTLRGSGMRTAEEAPWLPCAEVLWVAWLSPRRPAAEHGVRHVLAAVSNRGVLYFLAATEPFDAAAVHDFLRRLVTQLDRPVNVVIRWWPVQHFDVLLSWREFRSDDLSVRFSLHSP
ncbi:helix-turn-helix domain-containing protein [Amycolatopsis cynarae]|uniref:Helix-turn-helix domain-containing protein n=1 Tax=Amycolatopsis cynarae TaxID=2995223 RepID=A0ABY7AZR1_9PSEU|nr:helix-turn-helix domain-containing protein [Amycolatopsis sp. HUAS 11-8]WAL65436.1 helix-turn-helix domain-containing protein [Amycolatopsis sp. HUAS 11-8]